MLDLIILIIISLRAFVVVQTDHYNFSLLSVPLKNVLFDLCVLSGRSSSPFTGKNLWLFLLLLKVIPYLTSSSFTSCSSISFHSLLFWFIDLRSLESNKETREAIEDLSPRGVLGDSFQLSDSCSSKASTSSCEQQSVQSVSSPWRGLFRIWKPKSMRRFSTFSHVGVPRIPRGRSNRESQVSGADPNIDATFCLFKPSWKSFKLSELQSATNNFSASKFDFYLNLPFNCTFTFMIMILTISWDVQVCTNFLLQERSLNWTFIS